MGAGVGRERGEDRRMLKMLGLRTQMRGVQPKERKSQTSIAPYQSGDTLMLMPAGHQPYILLAWKPQHKKVTDGNIFKWSEGGVGQLRSASHRRAKHMFLILQLGFPGTFFSHETISNLTQL